MRLDQVLRVRRPVGRREAGFSFLQLVAAVAVLLSLALALPAWLAVRVNQARIARAQREAQAIAEAIERFERDFSFLPTWLRAGAATLTREADTVDLLVGPGEVPKIGPAADGWTSGRVDTLGNQLISNGPGYFGPAGARVPAWRGPYLTAPPDADPWQNRYMVNVEVAVGRRGAAGAGTYALVVVSAGPNGIVETAYWQSAEQFRAGGDDIVVKVRRAGRQGFEIAGVSLDNTPHCDRIRRLLAMNAQLARLLDKAKQTRRFCRCCCLAAAPGPKNTRGRTLTSGLSKLREGKPSRVGRFYAWRIWRRTADGAGCTCSRSSPSTYAAES